MRGEFLDLHGTPIYYYAAGSRGAGEPIVLLHGFPTSSHLWSNVVPLLPEGHRVVVLDLLGFGRSSPPGTQAVDLHAHADRVVGVLDLLGVNEACLVGHDLGGGIAQSVALRFPQRVSRLCLVDSVGFGGRQRAVRLSKYALPVVRQFPPEWIVAIARADLVRGYVDPDRGARSSDLYLRPFATPEGRTSLMCHFASMDRRVTRELGAQLSEITCPTAIVWGERDPFNAPHIGQQLHEHIHGSTLQVIAGAKHFTPEESSHEVAGAIGKLLGR